MPMIVLCLSFFLKMLVDRTTTAHNAIDSALELPVDISFLSISLIVGFILTPNSNSILGLAWFSFYIVAAIFIVFIWRRSTERHQKQGHYMFLGFLNYLLSITGLYYSIKLLTGGIE